MIDIVKQSLDFYLKNGKAPTLEEIEISNQESKITLGSCFVTLFYKWEIIGSSGNIKELKKSLAEEIIENAIQAGFHDTRFSPLTAEKINDVRVRIDVIKNRRILQEWELGKIDPIQQGVIAIEKKYSKLAVLLPNISPLILTGKELIAVLTKKLDIKKIEEKKYILYAIDTEIVTDY